MECDSRRLRVFCAKLLFVRFHSWTLGRLSMCRFSQHVYLHSSSQCSAPQTQGWWILECANSKAATEELMTEITCYSLEWQPLNARPRITHEKGCNMVCSRVSAEWDEWGYSFWKGNPSEDKSCLCLSQKSCTWTHTASTTSERPTILCVPCVRGRRYLSVTQGGGNLFSQRETGRYTNHDNAAFSHPFC